MISVRRDDTNKPEGFDKRSQMWVQRFEAARNKNPKLTMGKYWAQVRKELRDDAVALYHVFSGKCAFCEAKMAHVANPQIEHYRPKSRIEFSGIVFKWDNWLLSCGRCNESKWAHFPDCGGVPCLIDPTVDDPQQHVGYVDHIVHGTSARGEETVRLLKIDRSPLEDERHLWLMQIDSLLVLCVNARTRPEARRLLIWSMQSDAPYSSMTRSYLKYKARRLAEPAQPHPHVELERPREWIRQFIEQHREELSELA
ncbi:hypothetical protein [Sorangium sp. So ce145]|uniref:hypothetical protein n=1 Tax=Sorangium sp. So ce145 TaxID=3133285 RepID=UPI003F5EA8D3